ncbi:putative short-chain dehydrogenase [Paenibacillus agaridevorans]|uniref:Putative short-chain dehydrogenase n=1 Tax=Paenibacillus agaridevorans TaxID=171404 RepID=A0A2R5EVY2_9BACL|nr:putative short-chain dehydrogenase [Paenibacillus agaridevorans]
MQEHFSQSETPYYIGRGLAALAAAPDLATYSGKVLSSWMLSDMYGIDDVYTFYSIVP